MPYATWKVIHILGILTLFASLGGLAALRMIGETGRPKGTALFNALHGLALALVLLAGFGLLAKLGISSPAAWPGWVWLKLLIWLLLGASLVALKRAGRHAGIVLVVLTLLGATAAWAALFKPF